MTGTANNPAPEPGTPGSVYWNAFIAADPGYREPVPPGDLHPEVWRAVEAGAQAVADAACRPVYRERARLIAFLAACYLSVIALDGDLQAPGWAVIYTETPAGQMTWHLSASDLDLFPHVEQFAAGDPALPAWDGHSAGEKYERLAELTRAVAREGM